MNLRMRTSHFARPPDSIGAYEHMFIVTWFYFPGIRVDFFFAKDEDKPYRAHYENNSNHFLVSAETYAGMEETLKLFVKAISPASIEEHDATMRAIESFKVA